MQEYGITVKDLGEMDAVEINIILKLLYAKKNQIIMLLITDNVWKSTVPRKFSIIPTKNDKIAFC